MKTIERHDGQQTKAYAFLPRLDAGVKFMFAIILSIAPFLYRTYSSLLILTVFLLLLTLLSGVRTRTIFMSIAGYGVIVIFPYVIGFFISFVFYLLTGNEMFSYQDQYTAIATRLYQLFLLWYVGSLYFNTTPMKSVIGLFDKLLTPLKWLKVPISEYLKVMMCIVNELAEVAPTVKQSFKEAMTSESGQNTEGKQKFRINFKNIANLIVNFIVNSFKRLDAIEKYIEEVQPEDLYGYQFRISLYDILASCCMIVVFISLYIVENRYL